MACVATAMSGLAGTRVKVSPKQYHDKQRITARSPKRFTTPVHATGMSPLVLGAVEAAAKPGDVDAPFGLIVGGAILVTIILTAGIPALLSPGNKAAEKIFERDARSGRKR